jgi:hypothetical protein
MNYAEVVRQHSINCTKCGKLIDEREACMFGDEDGNQLSPEEQYYGQFCESCFDMLRDPTQVGD